MTFTDLERKILSKDDARRDLWEPRQRRYSGMEKRCIADDYRSGMPMRDIMRKYNCSTNTVKKFAQLAGYKIRPHGGAGFRRNR